MRLDEAVAKIKEKFPKAIDIGNPEKINQNGLFLYFDGTTPSDLSTDIAHFVLLLAGNSLTSKADDSVINELIRLRKGVLEIGTSLRKQCFKGIKAAVFEGSTLFMYALKIDMEIKI